jgi:hypothetical protein
VVEIFMKNFIFIFVLFFCLTLSSRINSQGISDTLKSLYFNAPLNRFDSSLIESLKTEKNLVYFNVNSIFQFPPSDVNDFFYKYFFNKPFILNGDSLSGYLFLHIKKMTGSENAISLSVTYDSLNEKSAKSLFDYLFKMFSNYYNQNESELRLGIRTDSKYFNFRQINLAADLYLKNRGSTNKPEYEVTLVLFRK